MKLKIINEDHVVLEFSKDINMATFNKISVYEKTLLNLAGIHEVVCGYNQIMIHYDESLINIEATVEKLEGIVHDKPLEAKGRIIKIPVCYDPLYGLDHKEVCEIHGIDSETLIKKHTEPLYPVYMMGFLTGFPYLGHLDESLETKRRQNPRTKIPKGSVGIGGKQTGVYPCSSPGGWQIIGRTPLELVDIKNNDTRIHRGDYVKFYAIDSSTYEFIKGGGQDERD